MRIASLVLAVALACPIAAVAAAHATTTIYLTYQEDADNIIRCPANYECTVKLGPGEVVNKGNAADIGDWNPRIAYAGNPSDPGQQSAQGNSTLRPYLILRPSRSGLRTNIFVTTSQRSYSFLLLSNNGNLPMHYVLDYKSAISATPAPSPTPVPVTDLSDLPCKDSHYSFDDAPDHKTHAQVSHSKFLPVFGCNDGEHTYLQLPKYAELPSDLPVLSSVDSQHPGGIIVNYVYDASHFRYVVDGVPDRLLLLYGSPKDRVLVRVTHDVVGDLR